MVNGLRPIGRNDFLKLTTIGISADFLLGRDVAPQWNARAPIGSLADAMHAELIRRRPSDAVINLIERSAEIEPIVPLKPNVELLQSLVDQWWSERFLERTRLMADRFERLAARLRVDAFNLADEHRRLMVYAAGDLEVDARDLRQRPRDYFARHYGGFADDRSDPWLTLVNEENGEPLETTNGDLASPADVLTPFRVPYNRGYVYRDAHGAPGNAPDHIWFIAPITGEAQHRQGSFLEPPETVMRRHHTAARMPLVSEDWFRSPTRASAPQRTPLRPRAAARPAPRR
jgi:hypothetical protein